MDRATRRQQADLEARLLLEAGARNLPRLVGEVGRRWSPRWRARLRRRGASMAPTAEAVGRVTALCARPDAELRRSALQALANAGPHVALARPALLRALADPEPRIRLAASDTLVRIPLTTGCITPLQRALGDDVWTVRWRAARALVRLGALDGVEEALCATLPRSGAAHEWEQAVRALPDLSTELAELLWRYDQDLREGRRT